MSNTSGQVIKKKAAIDFKMVTFSIAGKEYAIDIMKVKEISKERNFTYVPNAPMYVLGVHNLRGEIIPVID
ncbi:MAG: chemotaxis protein CheW, partial [Spirochaetes bacterium]|nr:chemotaxis protein CheW [Spirochaetota bacterium]